MTAHKSRCLEPEVIAAFVAGNLSGTELEMTVEHLRDCEDCREVVAEAARVDRKGMVAVIPPPKVHPHPASPWWLTLAAAALAGIALLAYQTIAGRHVNRSIRRLAAASPRDERYVEPRLSGGFQWAPLHSGARGGDDVKDPERLQFMGVAGQVLKETASDTSANGRHAAAMAHLLAGEVTEAESVLTKAAATAGDAQLWSDLAAVRYTAAVQTGDGARLAEALAAADAALRIEPESQEALFNRALIIERLGLRDQARTAWERYLSRDANSQWSKEAREHLRALAPLTRFRDELTQRYADLQNDAAAARALAREHPQEARVWGETEILGRWAEAEKNGDTTAEKHLRVARAFADVLRPHGEKMLADAIDAIDHSDAAGRGVLAEAHLRFREAQRLYRSGQPAMAEAMFGDARRGFERAGSPVALLAAYFAANTTYDQGRLSEARSTLEQLYASAPAEYPAYQAQVGWQLGLARASAGHWGDAIDVLSRSVASFELLGEPAYANSVRDIMAEVYDRLGESRLAWSHRVVALKALGRSDPSRIRVALDAAARGAALNRDWAVTVSLLGLRLEALRGGDDNLGQAETLLDRARVEARIGDRGAAGSDIQYAAGFIHLISDRASRERVEADSMAVKALLVENRAEALQLLTQAIDFHRAKGRRMFLPELLLQRGRAFAAVQRSNEAAGDFEEAIREIEAQRHAAGTADDGFATFAVAAELYEEAISLASRRGDVNGAFSYAERSRITAADHVAPLSHPVVQHGNVVIEYATLADRLLIFLIDEKGLHSVERLVSRDALVLASDAVVTAASTNNSAQLRRTASRLYQDLIRPVEAEIHTAEKVVFVPDATLDAVPFGALVDGHGHFFLENHAVVSAPSAAWTLGTSSADTPAKGTRLLLMEGATRSGADTLLSTQREADAVLAAYGGAADRFPHGGDRSEFETRVANADIVHFVGHAAPPDQSNDAALITLRSDGFDRRLTAAEIAAMRFPRTRAVVLAACGTARGQQRPGQTSISIARAFLTAGVPSVAATLWPIDDSLAAEFFPRFHALLAQRQSPADALRETQIEWIHRPDPPPRMWAAVQIIGR